MLGTGTKRWAWGYPYPSFFLIFPIQNINVGYRYQYPSKKRWAWGVPIPIIFFSFSYTKYKCWVQVPIPSIKRWTWGYPYPSFFPHFLYINRRLIWEPISTSRTKILGMCVWGAFGARVPMHRKIQPSVRCTINTQHLSVVQVPVPSISIGLCSLNAGNIWGGSKYIPYLY